MTRTKAASDFEHVLRGGVELLGWRTFRFYPILLAADHPGLNLQDQLVSVAALKKRNGDVQVLLQRQSASVKHVTVEEVGEPGLATPLRFLHQRDEKAFQQLGLAVVRVQSDVDVVAVGNPVDVLGDGYGAQHHVLYRRS